jgi:hypothetical protein
LLSSRLISKDFLLRPLHSKYFDAQDTVEIANRGKLKSTELVVPFWQTTALPGEIAHAAGIQDRLATVSLLEPQL